MFRIFAALLVMTAFSKCKDQQPEALFSRVEFPFVTILPDTLTQTIEKVRFKFEVAPDCYSDISVPVFLDNAELKELKILASDLPPTEDCNNSIYYTNLFKVFSTRDIDRLTINFLDRYNDVATSRTVVISDQEQTMDYLWKIYLDAQNTTVGDEIAVVYYNKKAPGESTFLDTLFTSYSPQIIFSLNNMTYDSLYYNILYDDGACNNCLNKQLFMAGSNFFTIKKKIPEVIRAGL